MIDIVFLLIIFFMTVAQITRTADIQLELPQVELGAESQVTATTVINVTETGEYLVGGKQVSLEFLLQSVGKRVRQVGGDPDRIRIQLRVHKKCPSRHVTGLLTELASAGFTHVRSAVID